MSALAQTDPMVPGAPPGQAAGALPRLIKFTGTLSDVQGTVVVTFALYRDQTGGTALWQEAQQVTPDGNGRYAIYLGVTSPEGVPLDVFASGDARWLGVQVAAQDERPRVMLASVPYALAAGDAQTLGGKPASAYLQAPADLSHDTAATGAANVAAPRQPVSSISSHAVSSTSPLVTNSMTTDGMNVVFTDPNGQYTGYSVQNLGTSATSYSGMLFYDQFGALGQFQGFNNSTHEYRINNIAKTGGSYDGSINFMIGGNSKFLVASGGNVGIGTTSPGFKLDVSGDINIAANGMLRFGTSQALRLGASYAGVGNTALGVGALTAVTTGTHNTGVGFLALTATTGIENTAVGSSTLVQATGSGNTALGTYAGNNLTTGTYNTFVGYEAGASTGGSFNTVVGDHAGASEAFGANSIFLGSYAGFYVTGGGNNIEIGNRGVSSDTNIIRIGVQGTQTATYIAGIRSVTTGGAAIPVLVDSNGQLGTASSSRTVKRDIENMGDTTSTIMALRPVRFRYIAHGPDGPEQYGLVAEEVAEVAPDLVAHKPDGAVETVYYDKVNAMLLNEVQKLHRVVEAQKADAEKQRAEAAREAAKQDARIRALEEALANRKK